MNIFRITLISIPLLVVSNLAFADSEDKKKSGAAEPVTPIEEPKAEVAPPPKVEEPAPAPPPAAGFSYPDDGRRGPNRCAHGDACGVQRVRAGRGHGLYAGVR